MSAPEPAASPAVVPDVRLPDGGWIDLDAAPVAPPGRRHPFRAVLVVVAVAGLAAGAAVAAATAPGVPGLRPSVVARVTLSDVVTDPAPAAVLRLGIGNRGADRRTVRDVFVSGGGAAGTTVRVHRSVSPTDDLEAFVTVRLDCPPGVARTTPTDVVLHLAPDVRHPGATTVAAVPVGRIAEVGGLCSAADAALPAGWRSPARVASWGIADGHLDLTVSGLPPTFTRLVSVEADGVLLPQPDVVRRTGTDGLQVVVGAPAPGCRDGGLRPVVAGGIQLRVETAPGLTDVYVPLGAAFSQWLVDAYTRACPAHREGPPAVRAFLEG